jgi:hypothetical protein
VAKESFRRTKRGYDPDEVDAAIEARDARLARLEREAEQLAERVVEREKRLHEILRRPVTGAVTKGVEEIYDQARRQATRMRMKALADAIHMADRVVELSKLRDELGARVNELADIARSRLGMEAETTTGPMAIGDSEGEPPQMAASPAGPPKRTYDGKVEVEVGPLSDFAQLTGFEDAASGIDGASEVRLRRFAAGRATVSLNLDGPVELLRELEERSPFEFVVRDTRQGGLVLDVDEDGQDQNRAA